MPKLLFALTLFFFFSLGVGLFPSSSISASSAKLFLSPPIATKSAGSSFSVDVRVNSGGEKINSAAALLTFNQDLLEASLVSENSWATVFSQKEVDNQRGSIKLNGGASQSTEGENLLLGTINFKVKKPGTARVNFTDQSVIYKGTTNVLGSSSGGVYTLTSASRVSDQATPASLVSSQTPATSSADSTLPKAGILEQSLYLILLAFGSIALGFVLNRRLS